MSCLGVLFSLDKTTVDKLKSFSSDEDRLDYLQMGIEEEYFSKYPDKVCELDKAWDAIHRTVTDGKLEWDNGSYPMNHFILGGEILYSEQDYIMTLKTPEQVHDIFKSFESVTKDSFKNNYFKIDKDLYGFETTEEDFEYTWTWFSESRDFWSQASEEQRYVLFTADQ
jgi:hypothetical protein